MSDSKVPCDNPRCICCRGYNAVVEYEKENGIVVETIELDHNEIIALKEEFGSWFQAMNEAKRRFYENKGDSKMEQFYAKQIEDERNRVK